MMTDLPPLKTDGRLTVLFVCTGNICRSPMAEYYLRFLAEQHNKLFTSFSAGIHACKGSPASELAAEVMQDIGIDMGAHTGKQLNDYMLTMSDIVLVMEAYHKNVVDPASEKILLLSSFDSQDITIDIADPYGRSLDDYRRARDRIIRCIDSFFQTLVDSGQSRG